MSIGSEEAQPEERHDDEQQRNGDDHGPLRACRSDRGEEHIEADEDREEEGEQDDQLAQRAYPALPLARAAQTDQLVRRDRQHCADGDEDGRSGRDTEPCPKQGGVMDADHDCRSSDDHQEDGKRPNGRDNPHRAESAVAVRTPGGTIGAPLTNLNSACTVKPTRTTLPTKAPAAE